MKQLDEFDRLLYTSIRVAGDCELLREFSNYVAAHLRNWLLSCEPEEHPKQQLQIENNNYNP